MRTRTWIILGLLAGAAVAVHRAETAPVSVPAPPHDAEPARDVGPRLDPRDDLIEHVAAAPDSRMPELVAALVAGVEVDDEPAEGPDVVASPSLDKTYLMNIPVPRTFEAELGTVGEMQADVEGVTFSGDVGIENSYLIDGDGDAEPTSDL